MAMTVYVKDIVTDAMRICGAVKIDEPPTASEAELGIRVLNTMLDRFSVNGLLIRGLTQDSLVLTPGKVTYTIGASGADWTAAKPTAVNDMFVRDDSGVDIPLNGLTQEQYDEFADKSFTTGRPDCYFYDPGIAQQTVHTGTLAIYPAPDDASVYTLYMNSSKYMTELVNWVDVIIFEPVYYEPLTYNLALRLFHHYHRPETPIPEDLKGIAAAGIRVLETLNATPRLAAMDLPRAVSAYNIYTDT